MNIKFLWIVLGIFTAYFFFATMQEKLLKSEYGDGERFTFVMTLLCINSIVSYSYTLVIKVLTPYTVEKPIPTVLCVVMALLVLLAMASSFMALKWVSYPAQVLAKSIKPVPVLFMGALLGHKQYPLIKYVLVLLIVFGITLFFYNAEKATSSEFIGIGMGELLLVLSLLMDGLLNSLQERILSKYKPHSNYLMMVGSKWSVLLTFIISILSGEGLKTIEFVQKFPNTIILILGIAFCGAIGQFFIFQGLTELGTLPVSMITTTRKFFTVLTSVIIFGHQLVLRQWIAIVCIFSGLLLDTYFSKRAKKTVTK